MNDFAPLDAEYAEYIRHWLCDTLGFSPDDTREARANVTGEFRTGGTRIVYSDALGKGKKNEWRHLYEDIVTPKKHPNRSKNFADIMEALFERVTKKKLPKPCGFAESWWEGKTGLIKTSHDLAILGSEISNALFREMFSDTRGGGLSHDFGYRDTQERGWFVDSDDGLPIGVATNTAGPLLPDGSKSPGLSSHKEYPRGFKLPGKSHVIYAADDPRYALRPIGDFIITKLETPRELFPPRKVLSVNGLHGKGALAARQLFEFLERPDDMRMEMEVIDKIEQDACGRDSWQVVVRATDFYDGKFKTMKIMGFYRVSTRLISGSRW